MNYTYILRYIPRNREYRNKDIIVQYRRPRASFISLPRVSINITMLQNKHSCLFENLKNIFKTIHLNNKGDLWLDPDRIHFIFRDRIDYAEMRVNLKIF